MENVQSSCDTFKAPFQGQGKEKECEIQNELHSLYFILSTLIYPKALPLSLGADFWKNFTIVEDATTGIDVVEGITTISADKIFSISGQ